VDVFGCRATSVARFTGNEVCVRGREPNSVDGAMEIIGRGLACGDYGDWRVVLWCVTSASNRLLVDRLLDD